MMRHEIILHRWGSGSDDFGSADYGDCGLFEPGRGQTNLASLENCG